MRYALLFLIWNCLAVPGLAQSETTFDTTGVTAVVYTVEEELEYGQNAFLSSRSADLRFRLVTLRNVDTGQVIRGVEVQIAKQKNQVVGGSIGGAVVGSLFGASTDVTYRRIRESGHIFLREQDLQEVNDFLESTVQALGTQQTQEKILKVSLQQGFELGMMYDPDLGTTDDAQTRPRWSFLVSADGATYRLTYQNGLEVIRTLDNWKEQLVSGSSG
jgi:hypothetical protein